MVTSIRTSKYQVVVLPKDFVIPGETKPLGQEFWAVWNLEVNALAIATESSYHIYAFKNFATAICYWLNTETLSEGMGDLEELLGVKDYLQAIEYEELNRVRQRQAA